MKFIDLYVASPKNFGPKNVLIPKYFWSKKIYVGPKNFWSQKIFGKKKSQHGCGRWAPQPEAEKGVEHGSIAPEGNGPNQS